MRALDPSELEERKKRVLRLVVHQYVRTAKPVSSQSLSEEGRLDLSSASIRNVLAELEEEGYLTHPHTSAGRIPTDKGYRFYVDALSEVQRLAREEEERIRRDYELRMKELKNLMIHTSRMLSSLSHYTGFAMTSLPEVDLFQHLELVNLPDRRLLVLFVTKSGIVRQKTFALETDISQELLSEAARVLNSTLQGLTLKEAVAAAQEKLEAYRQRQKEILDLAELLSESVVGDMSQKELYVEGASNIFNSPDFSDFDELRSLFKIMEEKQLLSHWVQKEIKNQTGVHVVIGRENPYPELKNLSFISSAFKTSDKTVGVLGIIGPKRMEYPRMIALVDFFSRIIDKMMNEEGRLP